MSVGGIIAVYFVIWWVTLFAVLPIGVRSQQEHGQVVPGSEPSAPARMNLSRIILINSIVASFVFVLFWLVYVLNIFDLQVVRDISRR
jgi:predicted secreted protein